MKYEVRLEYKYTSLVTVYADIREEAEDKALNGETIDEQVNNDDYVYDVLSIKEKGENDE